MKKVACGVLWFLVFLETTAQKYQPDWSSLNKRPTPAWFSDAKLGIFITWGLYSVPSYKPTPGYAEWIGHGKHGWMKDSMIRKMFGDTITYKDFADKFKATLFNPMQWADLVSRSGAKYVIFTSKYHDGFCMWPSRYGETSFAKDWNALARGPKRDIVGELTAAMKNRGIKMGLYWSVHEWFHPLSGVDGHDFFYNKDPDQYGREHLIPQFKELVNLYHPDLIFGDGDTQDSYSWHTPEMIAWLYNDSPVKDSVVINDRWGFWQKERGNIGDYYTTEYGEGFFSNDNTQKPWEESRGMGTSYGFNRNENIDDYRSSASLIGFFVDIVSKGGNLALNIGPAADGTIPVIMQQRLIDIGNWLKVNGEAIYGSRRWIITNNLDTRITKRMRIAGTTDTVTKSNSTPTVFYTTRNNGVFAICTVWPGNKLFIPYVTPTKNTRVLMLGIKNSLKWKAVKGGIEVEVPQLTINQLPCSYAWTFKLWGISKGNP